MIAGKKPANAVVGKTTRACDSCVRKRARWYRAADDAFLCRSCDASVHSTGQSSDQHERVLLQDPLNAKCFGSDEPEPTWHQGFTRRARTPRQRAKCSLKVEGKSHLVNSSVALVPEEGSLEATLHDDDEEEEQLLYRVPVFDPFETDRLCNDSNDIGGSMTFTMDNKHELEYLELLELAADVKSLLCKGFDDASCRIEDLGLTNNYRDEDNAQNMGICFDESRVKVEDKEEEEAILGLDFDATRETLDWDLDYESPMMIKEEDTKVERMMIALSDQCNEGKVRASSLFLRLKYEDVINAWGDQGSPWTNGTRPELNPDGSWPDLMGSQWPRNNNPSFEGIRGSDVGREARVSRYREKRRSRLFSKKIRYEVRKLNAEKRPRMKGRFVKREIHI